MRRLALVIVATLAGCGDGPRDERSVSAAPVPRAHYDEVLQVRSLDLSCRELAAARCVDFVLCASFEDRAHYRDEPECIADVARACVDHGNLPGVDGAGERADDCARKLRALACNDRRDPDAQLRACTVPGKPPRGVLSDGLPCVDGSQCAGAACAHDPGKRCGMCARAPAIGSSCATNDDCGATDLCCAGNACMARREIADPCVRDGECRAGLSCIMGHCAIGTMREGEVCIAGTNACDPRDALRCIGEEWTRCVRYEVLPRGASCVGGAMGLPVICGGADAYCRVSDWTCAERSEAGTACTDDLECGDGAACVQLDGRALCIATAEVCR